MKYYFSILTCVYFVSCFNLDVNFPTIICNPDGDPDSGFGQAVRFFSDTGSPVVLVGAPSANSKFWTSFEKPGQMFRCNFGSESSIENQYCQPYRIGESRSIAARNQYKFNGIDDKVKTADEYDHMLFGSTIEVTDKHSGTILVCGPRYFIQFRNRPTLGICFFKSGGISVNDTFNLVELEGEHFGNLNQHQRRNPKKEFDFYETGYSQMGLSAHILDSTETPEALLGIPGLNYWQGGLANATLHPGKNVQATVVGRSPDGSNSVYLGYSVTSMQFDDSGEVFFVAGAPGANHGNGHVFVTKSVGTPLDKAYIKKLNHVQILKGHSRYEFYGAAVLAVSYSEGSKNFELLVGAPQYKSSKTGYDEGKVYVYKFKRDNIELLTKNNQDGLHVRKAKGRFGTAMANIGDIDGDGFTDVAIGAPFEDGAGAVYIFKGSADGIEFKPAQHIKGSDFARSNIPISGFGISMDGYDADSNGYPDLAVGSFRSGHVIVLKSRPVISIDLILTSDRTTFGVNYTSDDNSFQLTSCVMYSLSKGSGNSPAKPKDVCATINMKYDIPPPANPRIELVDSNGVQNGVVRSILRLDENQWNCKNFTVRLTKKTIEDRSAGSEPLKFQLEVETYGHNKKLSNSSRTPCIPFMDTKVNQSVVFAPTGKTGNQDFCESCPVLKPGNSLVKSHSVRIVNDCGKEGKCLSDLSISAEFLKPDPDEKFILGKHKQAILHATVRNLGPHVALTPKVRIDWDGSSGVAISKAAGCSFIPDIRRPSVSCDLKHTLAPRDTENLTIVFDISTTHALRFEVTAEVSSGASEDTNKSNSVARVTCELASLYNVAVVGLTKNAREPVLFDRTTPTSVVEFRQRFQVEKTGPSPVKEVKVVLQVPRRSGNVLEMQVKSSEDVCVLDKTTESNVGPETGGETGNTDLDYEYQPEPDGTVPPNRRKREVTEDDQKRRKSDKSYDLRCGMKRVECDRYVCTFRGLTGEQNRTIELEGRFRPYEIRSLLDNHDVVMVRSEASLDSPEVVSNKTKDYCTSEFQSNVQALPSWVIPVAVIGALLLLIIISYILYKVGFFKRKKIPKPDAETEQLNEAECPPDEQLPSGEEKAEEVN